MQLDAGYRRVGVCVPIIPESLEVGQCYLTEDGRVRKVTRFLTDGRVRYKYRGLQSKKWRWGELSCRSFACTVERSVPCDWVGETDWDRAERSCSQSRG